jgi:hypothetical protein
MINFSGWLERIRTLPHKHSIKRISHHVPALLRIIAQATGVDLTISAANAVAALLELATSASRMSNRDGESSADELLSLAATQGQLAGRCELVERTQEKLRNEVTSLGDRTNVLTRDLEDLAGEIASLRRRNVYLGWGLLITFLVSCSAMAWKVVH